MTSCAVGGPSGILTGTAGFQDALVEIEIARWRSYDGEEVDQEFLREERKRTRENFPVNEEYLRKIEVAKAERMAGVPA